MGHLINTGFLEESVNRSGMMLNWVVRLVVKRVGRVVFLTGLVGGVQVLLLMRNLSINLASPEFNERVSTRGRVSSGGDGRDF